VAVIATVISPLTTSSFFPFWTKSPSPVVVADAAPVGLAFERADADRVLDVLRHRDDGTYWVS
jgi:hypothetical protein